MYLLREGSASTDEPLFLRLPKPPADYKEQQLVLFPEISVAKWFYESGIAERSLINWVTETFISPDKVFIDIGAHVGTYAWSCGKKAEHTYAFECSPKTFCYLAANVALQGLEDRITVYPFALSSVEGKGVYYIRSKDGGGNGIRSLSEADKTRETISVMEKTLDSFKLRNIGFIKIDVEGVELEVLKGAEETLRRNGYPKILFECWGEWMETEGVDAKKLKADLFSYLEEIGYSIEPIQGYPDMFLAEYKMFRSIFSC
jgi:FkbM family methyltransferase